MTATPVAQAWMGFDVGGSTLKAVTIDDTGRILRRLTRPTGPATTAASLGAACDGAMSELAYDRSGGRPIGVGVAGCVTLAGVVRGSPNLPALTDVALERVLGESLGVRLVLDNDAHCHALAEAWNGAAAGVPTFLLVTLGSGIGSALVIDGRIYRGTTGYGSEFGHMIVETNGRLCACGNRGCVEAYVSEVALKSRIVERSTVLASAVEDHARAVQRGVAEALFALADRGNGDAVRLVDALVIELGSALGSAVNVYDVEHIVLGGGMAPGFLSRADALLRAVDAALFARAASEIRVVPARSGALAGAVGAARMAMRAV